MLEIHHDRYKTRVSVVLLPYIYGDLEEPGGIIPSLLHLSLHKHQCDNKTLTIDLHSYSDISLPLLHIDDTMTQLLHIVNQGYYCQAVHIHYTTTLSLRELFNLICRFTQNYITPRHLNHLLQPTSEFPVSDYIIMNSVMAASSSTHILSSHSPLNTSLLSTMEWYENTWDQLNPNGKHDYIFTSYFTSAMDPQRDRHIKPDDIDYMKILYFSLTENKLKAIIFHDELTQKFRVSFHDIYVSFELVSLNKRSTNDARFYSYLYYLQNNVDIRRVLITDIADVDFRRNPFELMTHLGNKLYIGTDISVFANMAAMPWFKKRMKECFGHNQDIVKQFIKLSKRIKVYNAGIIGGYRSTMLRFLEKVCDLLNISPSEINCNMAAVNIVAHAYFDDVIFTGFPLTSRFWTRQRNPKGVYIIHK